MSMSVEERLTTRSVPASLASGAGPSAVSPVPCVLEAQAAMVAAARPSRIRRVMRITYPRGADRSGEVNAPVAPQQFDPAGRGLPRVAAAVPADLSRPVPAQGAVRALCR